MNTSKKSTKTSRIPKSCKRTEQKDVFVQSVNIETQTIYRANGRVEIHPCDFELNKHDIVPGNVSRVDQKGHLITEESGYSYFRPCAPSVNTGALFEKIFYTPHGSVKNYPHTVVFSITLPKELGTTFMADIFDDEVDDMHRFINDGLKDFLQGVAREESK